MHTYLLSDDVVRRYLLDFVDRLEALDDAFPLTWVTLGRSGDKIASALGGLLSEDRRGKLQLVRASFDRSNSSISFRDAHDWSLIADRCVLLIDSAIHSGSSMNIAAKTLFSCGVENIISYSLVVKRTSDFIPSFFGMLMNEYDRAFFQLEKFPNNRLQKTKPFGILRAIAAHDLDRDPNTLNSGVPSIDKISMADLMYGVKTQGSTAMLYEVAGQLAAFINFYVDSSLVLHIDAVAADVKYQGAGIGATLVRWAESYARSSKCVAIELWAISERVSFYERVGFYKASEDPWPLGKGETYFRMKKRILYNIKLKDLVRG